MTGRWIWIEDGQTTENERVCFSRKFIIDENFRTAWLEVTAVTKYQVWLNGQFLGWGPIRAPKEDGYLDRYGLEDKLISGENELLFRVWNYGWSTYQSLSETGGLLFSVEKDGRFWFGSDSQVMCRRDAGHLPFAPKRNVNLGFTDYYDARKPDLPERPAVVISKNKTLHARPVRPFHEEPRYADHIVRVEDADKAGTVYTVNLREALFPGRRDADETIMTGFIGCELLADTELEGFISFPNRSWNGILGDFRIGKDVYPVTDAARDIAVKIPSGKNLFLLRFHDKFDDLYCHIEFRLNKEPEICRAADGQTFFAIGPTTRLVSAVDGKNPVTESVEGYTEEEKAIFSCASLSELQQSGICLKWVEDRYVLKDMYLLSLARMAKVLQPVPVSGKMRGLLWNNTLETIIDPPSCGNIRRILLDFGDLYVGQLEFTLCAEAGAILDIYCFENCYQGVPDFTLGLNNGVQYICRSGWQKYRGMARIGLRYALISVRNASGPVRIRDFHLNASTYSVSGEGSFACSDGNLNRIWEMCRHTHLLCMEDSFTDCPTYEQAFWLGDAQTSAAIDHFVYGEYDFVRHNLLLAASALRNTPLFNALTPTDWNTAIPMWTFNWMISVTEYIMVTGDETILTDLYETVRDALLYYHSLLTEEGGLIVHSWNLIDWAPLDTPEGSVLTAYQGMLSCCFDRYAAYARKLEKEADAVLFEETARKMRRFLNEKLWREDRQAFCDAWHPQKGYSSTFSIQTHSLLLLFDGITDSRRQETAWQYLEKKPEGFVDAGSPFMLYYCYEAMASRGMLPQVLADIRKRWGEMLRYESTTCWEVFPGFYENSRTRSYAHAWSAAPAALMQKYLSGVHMEESGWKKISFSVPGLPGTEITWCRATIPTPHGPIRAFWDKETGSGTVTMA